MLLTKNMHTKRMSLQTTSSNYMLILNICKILSLTHKTSLINFIRIKIRIRKIIMHSIKATLLKQTKSIMLLNLNITQQFFRNCINILSINNTSTLSKSLSINMPIKTSNMNINKRISNLRSLSQNKNRTTRSISTTNSVPKNTILTNSLHKLIKLSNTFFFNNRIRNTLKHTNITIRRHNKMMSIMRPTHSLMQRKIIINNNNTITIII